MSTPDYKALLMQGKIEYPDVVVSSGSAFYKAAMAYFSKQYDSKLSVEPIFSEKLIENLKKYAYPAAEFTIEEAFECLGYMQDSFESIKVRIMYQQASTFSLSQVNALSYLMTIGLAVRNESTMEYVLLIPASGKPPSTRKEIHITQTVYAENVPTLAAIPKQLLWGNSSFVRIHCEELLFGFLGVKPGETIEINAEMSYTMPLNMLFKWLVGSPKTLDFILKGLYNQGLAKWDGYRTCYVIERPEDESCFLGQQELDSDFWSEP